MILAGDIGGTKTNLAFFSDSLAVVASRKFPSREHTGFGEIVGEFLKDTGMKADKACFGVAGAVIDGRCHATNLPWIVDAPELAARLGIRTVGLVNDLEANAWGIGVLKAADFALLNEGRPAKGNQAVISAGTGLGEAGLYWNGKKHLPFACEGGHSGFTPTNEIEAELGRYLLKRDGFAEAEQVLSGPGLHNIYLFLRDSGRGTECPWLAEEMSRHDPAPCISRAALEGTCPISVQALEMFVSIYGTEAANLALKTMATGGVFVGGGIAPKILEMLIGGKFLQAFLTRGPMRYLLEAIPVRVILNDRTALLGAAHYASAGRDS